jgi:hypothetical protein
MLGQPVDYFMYETVARQTQNSVIVIERELTCNLYCVTSFRGD